MGKTDTIKALQPAKGKGVGKVIFLCVVVGCLLPFGVPTLIVCCGLLPTLIALFTDTDPRGSGVATIGYMNMAGVLPYLIEVWERGHTRAAAITLMSDTTTWAVMLGAAGIGQLVLYAVPTAIAGYVLMRQEARLRKLKEGLDQLEAIWGAEVATTLPMESVRARYEAE